MATRHSGWLVAIAGYLLFIVGARNLSPTAVAEVPGSVVLPATLQTVVYLGDPYLAANVESSRVLMTGGPISGTAQDYYDRLHLAVAVLNPCHEDNYYVGNSIMAWAGSVDSAIGILRGATNCRFWDEVPPFFLGYNLHFFKRENSKAKDALFQAAGRSKKHRNTFTRIGIMYQSQSYTDLNEARAFLVAQRDGSGDSKWKQLLNLRIARLDGLIVLRNAQLAYEKRFGHPMVDPAELMSTGLLLELPVDPLHLGYSFENGQFALGELKGKGMEGKRK